MWHMVMRMIMIHHDATGFYDGDRGNKCEYNKSLRMMKMPMIWTMMMMIMTVKKMMMN